MPVATIDPRRSCSVFIVMILTIAGCAREQTKPSSPVDKLGVVDFPISCTPAVQSDFNHAVALLHHMTYTQAGDAFQAIAAKDPKCAMAQWGIAMTLFTPLWPTRPSADELQRGWQSAQRALALKPPTLREQLFIQAIADFFQDPASSDYWLRIARWETAMQKVHDAFPRDHEASAFFALALLAAARPGPGLQENSQKAVNLLLEVYKENSSHPGAMHYIIHANDMPGREHDNLDIVRRYADIAPDNPHALHMPTHIYVRLGDWDGVIAGNLRAADAALRYPVGAHGELVWDEFAHAIEYLVYAYLQQTADEKAAEQIARLMATTNIQPSAKTAFHLASTRARYALERHAWKEAAMLVPREPATIEWDRFPWPEAVTWFARGYGAVRMGDVEESRRAIARLQELESRADKSGEAAFARQIQMLRFELSGWTAHADHDDDTAVSLLRQAIDIEGNNPKPPVTPAATLPAAEILGDLLLELNRPSEALAAYQQSLQRFAARFNSTLGMIEAKAAVGDHTGAEQSYCELLRISAHGTPDARRDASQEFLSNSSQFTKDAKRACVAKAR
ncbi:MAG: hypothetical protein ABJB01_00135 [Rudaea sp.]